MSTDPRTLGTFRASRGWDTCFLCENSEDKPGSAICRAHRREWFPQDRQPAPRPLRRKRRRE